MKLKLSMTGLVFSIAMVSGFAHAGTENYAASECVQRSGAQVNYTFDGAVYNDSTTSRSWVLCHVPHTDFDGLLNAGEIDSGWADVVDLDPNSNVACRFRGSSLTSTGGITRYYGSLISSTGFGTNRQRLSLGSVSEDASSSYVLACDLPPRTSSGASKVHAYRVSQ